MVRCLLISEMLSCDQMCISEFIKYNILRKNEKWWFQSSLRDSTPSSGTQVPSIFTSNTLSISAVSLDGSPQITKCLNAVLIIPCGPNYSPQVPPFENKETFPRDIQKIFPLASLTGNCYCLCLSVAYVGKTQSDLN